MEWKKKRKFKFFFKMENDIVSFKIRHVNRQPCYIG